MLNLIGSPFSVTFSIGSCRILLLLSFLSQCECNLYLNFVHRAEFCFYVRGLCFINISLLLLLLLSLLLSILCMHIFSKE